MTRFSGPLKIKRPFEETTVASIDVSGSAKFSGGLSMVGNTVVSGNQTIHGAARIDGVVSINSSVKAAGPVRSGPNTKRTGAVLLVQQATVNQATTVNTTVAVLPLSADVVDIQYYVTNAYTTVGASGNKGVQTLQVGTSASETAFGTVDVSARGRYRVAQGVFTSAGTPWIALNSANTRIMAQVTAVDGAPHSAASGVLTITYIQK